MIYYNNYAHFIVYSVSSLIGNDISMVVNFTNWKGNNLKKMAGEINGWGNEIMIRTKKMNIIYNVILSLSESFI